MTELPGGRALFPGLTQLEVDFVIPRSGIDMPLGIDPFLLFKSRDPAHRQWHAELVEAFGLGVKAIREGRDTDAKRILRFPEPREIGLGYASLGKRGRGVGLFTTDLIVNTFAASPDLAERGLSHIEELQLLARGIGPDRISDIAANILKRQLVEYTVTQCAAFALETKRGVPVSNFFDAEREEWYDDYVDLPVNQDWRTYNPCAATHRANVALD